jgi:hypothetical protein
VICCYFSSWCIHKRFGLQNVNHYFAAHFMKRNRKTYSLFQLASAVIMILALLWLTISAPFVLAARQEIAKQDKMANASSPLAGNEEESANPFGNTTEEKSPTSSNSVSEEYLHDHHKADYFFSIVSQYHKCKDAVTYIAYHGELLVPPPNAA